MTSIILPAYNEEQHLGRTLAAINTAIKSIADSFEIIVADDASTDRTAEIAREHGARVVSVHNRQIAATRNAGANASRGEVLIFVDADTIVSEAVIRAAIAAMRAGAAGGGCAFGFSGPLPFYGRIMASIATPAYRWLGLASGCFLFCTRKAFEATGGFDEKLFAAEEAAMSRALKRHGKFVVLRESVATSGRKMRTYSAREIFGTLARFALTGGKAALRREGLNVWYGERRADPSTDQTG